MMPQIDTVEGCWVGGGGATWMLPDKRESAIGLGHMAGATARRALSIQKCARITSTRQLMIVPVSFS